MTALLSRRTAKRPAADLSAEGIHRDPGNHDPIATGSFSQRLVNRASGLLGGKSSRRSFLTRTAVVGSALAVSPFDFILKPGTAYGAICGTCTDGWTAFCCTINNGRNSCPPGSFVAGWWKADNAAYCCGAARYIIDCNATCPTQCSCRCAGDSCDGRKTCCNQFRYGQCHTEIACYGPVVCRVATCTPPWQYDPSCTTSSATDNRTVEHGAPCLTKECGSPIAQRYAALGGSAGVLGPLTQAEAAAPDGIGRVARYRNGNIYWTQATGAWEVHGKILTALMNEGGVLHAFGYPTAAPRRSADNKSTYQNFRGGRFYDLGGPAAIPVPNPFFTKHESLGGVHGTYGYPTHAVKPSGDKRSRYQNFANGRIYLRDNKVHGIAGAMYRYHEASSGVYGPLGYPTSDLGSAGDGRGHFQRFEQGIAWTSPQTGAAGLWGKFLNRYQANGAVTGYLGYPTKQPTAVGDGRGHVATFERGNIYASETTGGFQVHGDVLRAYLANGGPTGPLGYPTSELPPSGRRIQQFEGGTIEYVGVAGSIVTLN